MTAQQVALRLLQMIGVTSLDPNIGNPTNSRGISTGDLDDLAVCLTAAMQECLAEGPGSLSTAQAGGILMAPSPIAFPVIQYSDAIASQPSGWAAWMNECTVRVPGDPWDNRLRFDSVAGTYKFQRPVMCPTGTVTATVFCDALLIPFKNIVDPVRVGDRELKIASGMDKLEMRNRQRYWPKGEYCETWPAIFCANQRPVGIPNTCFADTTFNAALSSVPVYLRVSPMPSVPLPITYTGKSAGPTFTAADIDNGDHSTDPGRVIPEQWDESIFVPVARNIWQANPLCVLSDPQRQAVTDQYTRALKKLQSWRPQIGREELVYL